MTGWPDRRLKEALGELVDMEYLATEGSQGKAYVYSLLAAPDITGPQLIALTTPQELKEKLGA